MNGHDPFAYRLIPRASFVCAGAADIPIANVVTRSVPASPIPHAAEGGLGIGVGEGAMVAAVGPFDTAWLSIFSIKTFNVFDVSEAVWLDAGAVTIVKDPIVFAIASWEAGPGSCAHVPLGASYDVFIRSTSAYGW